MKEHYESARKLAINLREELGVSRMFCPDIFGLIARFEQHPYNIIFERVFDERLPTGEAQAEASSRTIRIRESTYHKLKSGDKRARFVLMEEVGHILCGHKGIRNRSTIPQAYERSSHQIRRDESEARHFAANFLAPEDLVNPDWDALIISEKFQISAEASEIRYQEIERSRRISSGAIRSLPQNAIDFLKEARDRGYPVQSKID